jgi:ribose transport system substrate-binding protein
VRSIGCLLAASVALTGCGKRSAPHPRVGVSFPADTSGFYSDVARGMRQAAESLGLDLRVAVDARDPGAQAAAVAGFVTERVSAIVIAPLSAAAIAGVLEQADAAHIPVFTVAVAAGSARVVAQVTSDDRQGGQLLGGYVARRLRGGGNVVVLDQPTLPAVRERVAGFREGLAAYPNIRIVAAPAVEGAPRALAERRIADLLATDQRIDAVFATDDECALGALTAVQAARRSEVFIVGYATTPAVRAAIALGTPLIAAAVQHPDTLGRYVVELAASVLRGSAVPALIRVRVGLVDRDSLTTH